MRKPQQLVPAGFPHLVKEIKARIQQAQTRALFAANVELVQLYWDIGRLLDQRQRQEGWGTAVIPRLAQELPEVKGFSERNIKLMVQFAHEYPYAFPQAFPIGQPPVAQLPTVPNESPLVAQIPWAHNVLLMQRVKEPAVRLWYMQQTLDNGWSRNILALQIQTQAHTRHGKAVTNFKALLPSLQSELAQQTFKDPYLFDFLTLAGKTVYNVADGAMLTCLERELTMELIRAMADKKARTCRLPGRGLC